MAKTHNLGFPRIGPQRELKVALEKHWTGALSEGELLGAATRLRRSAWEQQRGLDLVPVGDFSFYDHVLDTSYLLGNIPERAKALGSSGLDVLFRTARGRAAGDKGAGVAAGEMTKWFDTNYHYIVPEFSAATRFELNPSQLVMQIRDALSLGLPVKPVILGPISYLWLGKAKDGADRLKLLPKLVEAYRHLLRILWEEGADWVQVDEPALVTELPPSWQAAYRSTYETLGSVGPRVLLATYFGSWGQQSELVLSLPVAGVHLDAVTARAEVRSIASALPRDRVLSLGVVHGRNIWRSDLVEILDLLDPIAQELGDRLWIAPSCSLLHVPVDLKSEVKIDAQLKSWLAFAVQKLEEVRILGRALNGGRSAVREELILSSAAHKSRQSSPRVHKPEVQNALLGLTAKMAERDSSYALRSGLQAELLNLPQFPTTTIGSFPQTAEIRRARSQFKSGAIEETAYEKEMLTAIEEAVRQQEELGLDVLVHGEAERNDMVEYFGEQLEGYLITECGWVQSYGSRCVKPPILYGDVSRPRPITVRWSRYAQSLTARPMKGMLTGPVTMLNWSFVRDDQPRSTSCFQLALAIREEVLDLERDGVRIIQVDEPALREGLPLRHSEWAAYLDWAVHAFRVAANGVRDETQIHTHMCYSEFNDIIESIARLDADVITIETSRSDMELLDAFDDFHYPNEVGPGVYDIHSPNVPSVEQMVHLMRKAAERIPPKRLWVNPDCGLKTRRWEEVIPALRNMVSAAEVLRASL